MKAGGRLPPGSYSLCVVPKGTYSAGRSYSGASLNCVPLSSSGGAFGPLIIWPSAVSGGYDLLALGGADGDTIIAGDKLGAAVGLVVQALISGPSGLGLMLALLGAAMLAHLQRRRQARGT